MTRVFRRDRRDGRVILQRAIVAIVTIGAVILLFWWLLAD
jgi:hypothetical protein